MRSVFTALLTPLWFAYETGHFRSSLVSKAIDRTGAPLPWYTYPAIDLIRYKDFSEKRILEFGAGQSTLWWAKRARMIVSLESDPGWYEKLVLRLPSNVQLTLVNNDVTGISTDGMGGFDVIVIDGLDRLRATTLSEPLLNPSGLFIVDNSEGYWGPAGTYPIIDFLIGKGYARVDLYGFSPGNFVQHCTSLFFKKECFLFTTHDYPVRRQV